MKDQENGPTSQKGGKIRKVGKNVHKMQLYKVKKLSNYIKKFNKIFQFSEDFGASALEGIWHNSWEFTIPVGHTVVILVTCIFGNLSKNGNVNISIFRNVTKDGNVSS